MRRTKRHYYILYNGEYAGQAWATSEAEAVKNFWWNNVKGRDPFSERCLNPTDFEAIKHTA